MSRREFRSALQEVEAARQSQTPSPQAERRMRQRLETARTRPAPRVLPWAFAALATAAGVALAWVSVGQDLPVPAESQLGTFTVASAEGEVRQDPAGTVRIATAPAQLVDQVGGISIQARPGAAVRRDAEGLRVLDGEVVLDVRKRRPEEPPAVVLVSHGAIEVLGTRFTITQGEDGGQVVLHEGRIRFRAVDGRVSTLVPGDSLRWPLTEVAAAPTQPTTPTTEIAGAPESLEPTPSPAETLAQAPTPAPPPRPLSPPPARTGSPRPSQPNAAVVPSPQPAGPDVEGLIEEVSTLRRLGRFQDAATRLQGALAEPLPSSTRERLSYELGSILTWQLKDTDRACAVWAAHRTTWPDGRYGADVERAARALECGAK